MNQNPPDTNRPATPYLRALPRLFTNHLDAWGVALIIASLALVSHAAVSWANATILLAVVGAYWLAFAYNDYQDAAYDALEPAKGRRNFFVVRPVPRAWIITGLALFCGFFALGAYATFGWRGLLVLAISLPVIWGYSGRPLRLKSRPGLDLLTHAVFVETYPYLVTISLLGDAWSQLDIALLAILFFGSLTAQLEQQLADYELDARTEPNFTTRLGPRRTLRLLQATTLILAATGLFFAFNGTIPGYLIPFGLIAAPMLAGRFVRRPGQRKASALTFGTLTAGLLYGLIVLASSVFS